MEKKHCVVPEYGEWVVSVVLGSLQGLGKAILKEEI
jgi:hypothetical protein